MNQEARITELKRTISILRWDLNILKNEEIKAQKERQLRIYEEELNLLLNQKQINPAS